MWTHVFLTTALGEVEWPPSRSGRFTAGIHWVGGWLDLRTDLDYMEK
jgi:hypothetical protein